MNYLKGLFSEIGTFSKMLLLVGVTCIFSVFGMSVWTIIFHGNDSDVNSLKWLQLFESVGMFCLPPIVVAYLWSKNPTQFLSINKKINWLDTAYVFLLITIAIPFINLLGEFNQQLVLPKALSGMETWLKSSELQVKELTEKFLYVHSFSGLLFNILIMAIIPALGEELFFRGTIQNMLKSSGIQSAIWITAIVFSAIHIQFYGFLPRMLLGVFLGYLLFWTDSLWLPIAAHFVNNILAVIFYYLVFNGYNLPNIDTIGTGNTLWLGVASAALTIFGVFSLRKRFMLRKVSIN